MKHMNVFLKACKDAGLQIQYKPNTAYVQKLLIERNFEVRDLHLFRDLNDIEAGY